MESSQQNAPDNQSSAKEKGGEPQQVPTGNGDDFTHSGFTAVWFGDAFKFLESIAFVFWMIHEFVKDWHNLLLFIAIVFALAGAFHVLADKILNQTRFKVLAWATYAVCVYLVFHFKYEPESIDENKPVISEQQVQLGDGAYSHQIGETIFNPGDFTVFDVALLVSIKGDGVRADSVNLIIPEQKFTAGKTDENKSYYSTFTWRCDYLYDPTNQSILFIIGEIPARERFYFEIAGTATVKSSAKIEVESFNTNSPQILITGTSNIWSYPVIKYMAKAYLMSNSSGLGIVITNLECKAVEKKGVWQHFRVENY